MAGELAGSIEELACEAKSESGSRRLRISVIIPVRPGGSAEKAIGGLRAVNYPQEHLEILVVEGTQPSRQRNAGVAETNGEIVYFLDNDSEADVDLFRVVERSFSDPTVAVVGGPSEPLSSDSILQRSFSGVLGSFFAVANVRYRYKAIGRLAQQASEHKLILCNLGVRRDVLLSEGGLDERMYPNEENELLNRLRCRGYTLIYNPLAVVRRPQRRSLNRFARQMFDYGCGRMHHFLLYPQFIDIVYFAPLAFTVYLMSLLVAIALAVPFEIICWYLIPAGLYAFASVLSAGQVVCDERDWRLALVVPVLSFVVHISYALGMVCGLLRHPWRASGRRFSDTSEDGVKVRVLKPFGATSYSDL